MTTEGGMTGETLARLDRIEIKDLLLRGIIGINDEEREKKQDILVNVVLHADTRATAREDSLAEAVNYRSVTKAIIALVEDSAFHTIEKLAAEVARTALAGAGVPAVTVCVEKPGALRFSRSVGITIVRTPADFVR
jgi:D-erythro-7,8-dihydroneopterin triphosphate epimerase